MKIKLKDNSNKSKTKATKIPDSNIDINIKVSIKDWTTDIYCYKGLQTLNWLYNYALYLYTNHYALQHGKIYGHRNLKDTFENLSTTSTNFNSTTQIYRILKHQDHIELMLSDEFAIYTQNEKKKSKRR